jgi:putative Mg2+ transporter-C (MgtC) family protein
MSRVLFPEMLIRILASLLLGGVIGYERERESQPAGLRTHIILVVGCCLAMMLSINLGAIGSDPARLAAQVITGVGFLGAGAIMRYGLNIRGLTTASTLWTMSIVGLAIGMGYYLVGAVVTLTVFLALTVLERVKHRFMSQYDHRVIHVEMRDKPKVIRQVREAMSGVTKANDTFLVEKNMADKRLTMVSTAYLKTTINLDEVVQAIAEIDGVLSVKVE